MQQRVVTLWSLLQVSSSRTFHTSFLPRMGTSQFHLHGSMPNDNNALTIDWPASCVEICGLLLHEWREQMFPPFKKEDSAHVKLFGGASDFSSLQCCENRHGDAFPHGVDHEVEKAQRFVFRAHL
jgi:hypothetical protein